MGHCLFKNIVIHHNVVRHKFQHYVDVFDYEKQKKKRKSNFSDSSELGYVGCIRKFQSKFGRTHLTLSKITMRKYR